MWRSNETMVLKNTYHISIIGSSVALRIRPNEAKGEGLNYGQIIETQLDPSKLVRVTNLSLSRMLITEVEYNLDSYIRTYPDLYIINIGAVDAPTREIPKWYSNIIFKRKSRTAYKLFFWVHKRLITRVRKYLVVLRGYRSWVSHKEYIHNFKKVIEILQKETNAKILVLGINKGNETVEVKLPRTTRNYVKYNESLQQLCFIKSVDFLDVADLDSKEFFPDGVHYNRKGHIEIANRIINLYEQGKS